MSAQLFDAEVGGPVDYPDVDADAGDYADAPLLDPGSDGLCTERGPRLLMELARRREQGASLAQLRRDAGQIDPFRVTDRCLEQAVDQGARLNAHKDTGRIPERLYKRCYRGISVRECPVCGRRVLARALRYQGAGGSGGGQATVAGCVLCTEGADGVGRREL